MLFVFVGEVVCGALSGGVIHRLRREHGHVHAGEALLVVDLVLLGKGAIVSAEADMLGGGSRTSHSSSIIGSWSPSKLLLDFKV
jgi:hypothetical protein